MTTRPEPPRVRPCGNPECRVSSGIHCYDDGSVPNSNLIYTTGHYHPGFTFGSGELDGHGYWEFPCEVCARANEKAHPEEGPCWPFGEWKD